MRSVQKFAAAGAVASVVFLSACGSEAARDTTLVISDVTGSGMSEGARLDSLAKVQALRLVEDLHPGGVLAVYAFGQSLTSACTPISADFAEQRNSEEQKRLKTSLLKSMPPAYDKYVDCVHDKTVGGSDSPGSPIFGAIKEATVRASKKAPVTAIHLITDGCSYGENVDTCTTEMTTPGYAEKLIEAMPPALKPALANVKITVTGLGQGTGMSSEQLSVLRDIFTVYGVATGSTVEFG